MRTEILRWRKTQIGSLRWRKREDKFYAGVKFRVNLRFQDYASVSSRSLYAGVKDNFCLRWRKNLYTYARLVL